MAIEGSKPIIEKAIPNTWSMEKLRFNSGLYPIVASSWVSLDDCFSSSFDIVGGVYGGFMVFDIVSYKVVEILVFGA